MRRWASSRDCVVSMETTAVRVAGELPFRFSRFGPHSSRNALSAMCRPLSTSSRSRLVGGAPLVVALRSTSPSLSSSSSLVWSSCRPQLRRFISTSRSTRKRRENVIDAEPVDAKASSSSTPPRSDLSQKEIDEQFDKVYEKLYNKKRPRGGEAPANPFTQPWQERLFDIVFSNAGSFVMLTVLVSLFLQISREQGEHKEYKRVTTARLQEAQHALHHQRTQVHRAVDARRQEVQRVLTEAAAAGKVAMSPEEVRVLVDQVLAGLVSDIDTALTISDANTTTDQAEQATTGESAPASAVVPAASAPPEEIKQYHKVV